MVPGAEQQSKTLIYWYTNQKQIKSIKSGLGLCNKSIKSNRAAENHQSNQIEDSDLFDLIVGKSASRAPAVP